MTPEMSGMVDELDRMFFQFYNLSKDEIAEIMSDEN